MRHQHTLPAQDHIVLLSPDEASYRDAISYLNSACARRLDDFEWSLEVIPEGVEAMMWLEKRNAD